MELRHCHAGGRHDSEFGHVDMPRLINARREWEKLTRRVQLVDSDIQYIARVQAVGQIARGQIRARNCRCLAPQVGAGLDGRDPV